MPIKPFNLYSPADLLSSVVFSSPHSGLFYSPDFLKSSVLDHIAIRTSEDAFVDKLFMSALEFGSPLLAANVPRAFVDLNRDVRDLDPILVDGAKTLGRNGRASSGLGVIPRLVGKNKPIYASKISLVEAQARLLSFWHPYHLCLNGLLEATRKKFGYVILIDCHSMPHESVNLGSGASPPPQIVLGDRFGAAANLDIVNQVRLAFSESGFRVSRNMPYAGAYISCKYGKPQHNQHVIQVEIDRSLYMNEGTIQKSPNFFELKAALRNVISKIVAIGVTDSRLAAE